MRKLIRFTLFFFFLLFLAAPVLAQDVEYQVHPQRSFGYQAGGNVRGSFSLNIVGSQDNIRSVTYRMDGVEIAVIDQPPFKFSFNTGSFPNGRHAISAVVDTKDGRQVTTPDVTLNFLSADQESKSMQKIFIPLIGGIFLIVLIAAGAQMLVMRRTVPPAPGAPRSYGFKGGTICPRCGRAYAIHFWSINLPGGYFDHCDYCGKWAFVRSRSRADLDAAVRAEVSAAQASESSLPAVEGAQSEEERLRKSLDESKYVD
jgi:hypothetical protein